MKIEYNPTTDSLYVTLTSNKVKYSRQLDKDRRIDYAEDGTPTGINIINVSKGINTDGLPREDDLKELMEDSCIIEKVFKGIGLPGIQRNYEH